MSLPSTFPLAAADGKTIQIPSVGFGTWAAGDTSWAKDATLAALKAGYRHLDCAWMYGVDGAVGAAIRESGIPRSEIFVTTKFWPHFGHPKDVALCLDKCLEGMGLDYVDLYLSHWPSVWKPRSREALEKASTGPDATAEQRGTTFHGDGKPVVDWELSPNFIAKKKGVEGSFVPTWKAMQDCVRSGKARTVGVSNFSIPELEELLPHSKDIPLSCNQVENKLVTFGKEHGIIIACYSPFAGQKKDGATLLKDQAVGELASKNGMDVGQLLQSWAVQRGTVPLGKSQTPARIQSNLAIRKLSDEDMKALNDMALPDDQGRTVDPRGGWDIPMFN